MIDIETTLNLIMANVVFHVQTLEPHYREQRDKLVNEIISAFNQYRWVKVEDGLPNKGQKVLVIQNPATTATKEPLFAIYDGTNFIPPEPTMFATFEYGQSKWVDIISWMPLPSAPKGQQDYFVYPKKMDKTYTIKDIKDKKFAVNCDTMEEWKRIWKLLKRGKPISGDLMYAYPYVLCDINSKLYSSIVYAVVNQYTIINSTQIDSK